MKTLESLRFCMEQALGQALCCHNDCEAWHYEVISVKPDSHSLCDYLHITEDEWRDILVLCSLAEFRGSQVRIQRENWKQFIVNEALPGYFDKFTTEIGTSFC